MEREVKFSLVFRDMWQSAGKYVPRVDQLVKVALRTQKAVERTALSEEMQKTEVDCWQEALPSHKVSRVSWYSGFRPLCSGFAYGAFTLSGWLSQSHSATFPVTSDGPYPAVHAPRFGLFPFRSPLLWKSMFLSLPPAT